jgi:hypothetical protein
MSPHVQHVDILHRSVDPETKVLRTERLLAYSQPVPHFLRKLMKSSNAADDSCQFFLEISEVDPVQKKYTAVSTNLNFSNVIKLKERVEYTPSSDDGMKTDLRQEALVDVDAGWEMVKGYVEDLCVKKFCANAERGRAAMDDVIRRLLDDSSSALSEGQLMAQKLLRVPSSANLDAN